MPAVVASHARGAAKGSKPAHNNSLPRAKKAKLSSSQPAARPNGLKALLNGGSDHKPTAKTHGVKNIRTHKVNEATAAVTGGQAGHGDVDMEDAREVIEISSAGSDEDDDEDEDEEETPDATGGAQEASEDQLSESGSAEPEGPSLGDQLQAQEPEIERVPKSRMVDVESALSGADPDSGALTSASTSRTLAPPSGTTLVTVLTQALRTNDQDQLETCLRVNDVDSVYATIERLPSPLVGTLLHKLAERLHKRPGRPGMLMVWVQWSLSAHGGYLATQPHMVKQLAVLNKVLKERASGLQPLLSLKGRLDMLHTQLELRRRNQRKAANDEMDEAVIYVEGEDDASSDDDDADDTAMQGSRKRSLQDMDDDGESSVDEMPMTMEVEERSDEEDSDDLIDDKAEETEDDSGEDEMEEEMSDDMDEEAGSESEALSRPARRSTAGRAGISRKN